MSEEVFEDRNCGAGIGVQYVELYDGQGEADVSGSLLELWQHML